MYSATKASVPVSPEYKFYTGQYPYPLNKVLTEGGDFCKPFIEGDPSTAIPDVDNFYIICCTPDQMNKITSSLEVGAPIAFPSFYNDVLQLVDQAVQFPNSFEGAPCVDICQLIIDCINTNPETAAAILNLVNSNTQANSREYGQSQNTFGFAGGFNPSCDPDILWAQCFGIIETLNTYNEEFFAKLEVSTNPFEFVAEVIGDVTVVDETSIDAILAWIAKVQDDIEENYSAQATLAYRQEVACQIFCQALLGDCQVTATLIFNVFNERLAGSLTIESLITNILNYLVGGTWSGTEIADFMFLAQAGFRSALGVFLEYIGWNDIDLIARLYTNDANNDWETLCDDCGWIWNSDFGADENIWIPSNNGFGEMAEWESGPGWTSVDIQNAVANYGRFCAITTTTFTATEITQITVDFDLQKGTYTDGSVVCFVIVAVRSGGGQVRIDIPNDEIASGNGLTRTLNVNQSDVVLLRTYVRSSNATTPVYSGTAKINSIQVSGFSTNPFE